MRGLAPKLPLSIDSTDGFSTIRSQREMVKQNFKMLMLTAKGERIMEPEYGAGLSNFLFEQNTEETKQNIEGIIFEQTRRFMPYIRIEKLHIGEENAKLSISILYYVSFLGSRDVLQLNPGQTNVR